MRIPQIQRASRQYGDRLALLSAGDATCFDRDFQELTETDWRGRGLKHLRRPASLRTTEDATEAFQSYLAALLEADRTVDMSLLPQQRESGRSPCVVM